MRLKKGLRLSAISKILSDNPNKIISFSYFTHRFGSAKSTISTDINNLKSVYDDQKLGKIVTVAGAAGGVKYIPTLYKDDAKVFLQSLAEKLSSKERILPGGFLYLIDLIYDPYTVEKIAKIFSGSVDYSQADYLVTIETKGIPMAIMTAKMMNLPLLIIRKNTKISEGPSINITYITGKNNSKIQTMSLPIKSIKRGTKVILIDDFMRGGGTLKGMCELMEQFDVSVLSSMVIIETKEPRIKKISDCRSLLTLDEGDGKNILRPSENILASLEDW